MIRKQSLYFQDIKNAIESINGFIDGLSFDDFISDDRTFSAVIRKIEILGEAAKNISIDVRSANPHIPWTEMARMRDKLIHGYFGIDEDVVWKTIKEDLPEILPLVSKLCSEYKDK
ncbi:MAG: DUF86 domain-containing protein [Spirochaetes bacterium]|nr:DUF86 domain-containing protein [Spirochaetota bacterium]